MIFFPTTRTEAYTRIFWRQFGSIVGHSTYLEGNCRLPSPLSSCTNNKLPLFDCGIFSSLRQALRKLACCMTDLSLSTGTRDSEMHACYHSLRHAVRLDFILLWHIEYHSRKITYYIISDSVHKFKKAVSMHDAAGNVVILFLRLPYIHASAFTRQTNHDRSRAADIII